jgi:hypothetical protein
VISPHHGKQHTTQFPPPLLQTHSPAAMAKVSINWQRISSADSLRRSSHVIAVHENTVSVFGGELKPREPVPNSLFTVNLNGNGAYFTSGARFVE